MSGYEVRHSQERHYVLHGGELVAAISCNRVRCYVYPLVTPDGVTVLQECPPDHVHQQGIVVGQDLVNGDDFWAMLHPTRPRNRQELAADGIRWRIEETGVTMSLDLRWRTESGRFVLDEERTVRVASRDGFHLVDVTSIWSATYGSVYLGRTKEGGLGMRVAQQLEAEWGGTVRSSRGGCGEVEVFDTVAEWVEVTGQVSNRPVGVVMMPHPSMDPIPWFTRDYGLHMYGPMRHGARHLSPEDSLTLRVGFAAYDRETGESRGDEAWASYREQWGEYGRAQFVGTG